MSTPFVLSGAPVIGHVMAHEASMAQEQLLGVIGGSGLEEFPGLEIIGYDGVPETPFGKSSNPIIRARIPETATEILFLPRHGRQHRIPPHAVNYRANIYALKRAGATYVVGVCAVGSLREHIQPCHFVVPRQLIDWTRRRATSFFDDFAVHVALADPICPIVHNALLKAAFGLSKGTTVHEDGVHITIDGPQFSTRAESELYRAWKVDVIGMTAMPEAKLAREAEIPYALLCLVTDYDCWHPDHVEVDGETVSRVVRENAAMAQRVLIALAKCPPENLVLSPAHRCLDRAIASSISGDERRARLGWIRNPNSV